MYDNQLNEILPIPSNLSEMIPKDNVTVRLTEEQTVFKLATWEQGLESPAFHGSLF